MIITFGGKICYEAEMNSEDYDIMQKLSDESFNSHNYEKGPKIDFVLTCKVCKSMAYLHADGWHAIGGLNCVEGQIKSIIK